jgi:hypothetical protein
MILGSVRRESVIAQCEKGHWQRRVKNSGALHEAGREATQCQECKNIFT